MSEDTSSCHSGRGTMMASWEGGGGTVHRTPCNPEPPFPKDECAQAEKASHGPPPAGQHRSRSAPHFETRGVRRRGQTPLSSILLIARVAAPGGCCRVRLRHKTRLVPSTWRAPYLQAEQCWQNTEGLGDIHPETSFREH